jgi:8-oxo-dGTP diphosphatase
MQNTVPEVAMQIVHVAVGVVCNQQQQVLIALRRADQHQGGLWEFPGGKVEAGESVESALCREFREEVSLQLESYEPLIKIHHDYGDKQVLLDVWRILVWRGEACGREGQPLAWVNIGNLQDYHFPAANKPIVEALQSQVSSLSFSSLDGQ